ncbi:MAG: bifunctional (p)ppGpp synthetase/guanosine-3',5'-bis(diphosphate) 3'-pyrophosphohydrolase [Wenzhouxiangellaceae bacterium]
MSKQTVTTPGALIERLPEPIREDPAIQALLERYEAADEASHELAARMLRALIPLSPDAATIRTALRIALDRNADSEVAPPTPEDPLLEQFLRVVQFDHRYVPDSSQRAERLRRLILALIEDVRAVLLALAWQLARMQMARDEATRRSLAEETRAIHAPLANRLGIWQLKWPLEDLAFRYLEPEQSARIERLVAEQRDQRERDIRRFMEGLHRLLEEAGIRHEISGRAKHIYSIWKKMQRKGLDFHELYDLRAVRVLVDSVAECYTVLGLVHAQWKPVPGEFDDYISNPKPNGYRSLHTAVVGEHGRVFEIQIRTHEMHQHAELGVAAHWRYKEGVPHDAALEQRIQMMRQLIEGQPQDDDSLIDAFQNLTSDDRVYVLTPRGDVVDLVQGSTPLDFAYHVHTEIGHRCRGAKVNGRIVPLTHVLQNGDRVEILTAKQPSPSRDWLNPHLGYLHSPRARAKVRQYFRQLDFDENRAAGQAAVEAELRRLDLGGADLATVAAQYNYPGVDELLAAVGAGDLTATQIAQAVLREAQERQPASAAPLRPRRPPERKPDHSGAVHIEGVGNLLHQMARCCRPVPGDPIAGFITRTRGVSIHRADCAQYQRLAQRHPDRCIQVEWAADAGQRFAVPIRIEAWDRKALIKDIGTVLAGLGASVASMEAGTGPEPDVVQIRLLIEVSSLDQLSALLSRLQQIPNVREARRLH